MIKKFKNVSSGRRPKGFGTSTFICQDLGENTSLLQTALKSNAPGL